MLTHLMLAYPFQGHWIIALFQISNSMRLHPVVFHAYTVELRPVVGFLSHTNSMRFPNVFCQPLRVHVGPQDSAPLRSVLMISIRKNSIWGSSDPRTLAYAHFKRPSESSNLPGSGRKYKIWTFENRPYPPMIQCQRNPQTSVGIHYRGCSGKGFSGWG